MPRCLYLRSSSLGRLLVRAHQAWLPWLRRRPVICPGHVRWNVRSWPTIYVLDHKGVIRYKGPREKALDEAVDTLLSELEPKQGRGPTK